MNKTCVLMFFQQGPPMLFDLDRLAANAESRPAFTIHKHQLLFFSFNTKNVKVKKRTWTAMFVLLDLM